MGSCEKSIIEYTDNNNDDFTTDSLLLADSGRVRIDFYAQIDNPITRATNASPIETERYVDVYAYTTGENSGLAADVSYYSKNTGTITPVNQSLKLDANQAYSLYAVGVNAANTPIPSFDTQVGYASDIQNGTDYIWCALWNVIPTGATTTCNLLFKHCCTQVILDLVVQEGITIDGINYVSFVPSDPTGMTWNLFNNGQIGPTSSIASHAENIGFKKTAFGFRAAYIMVPISVKRATYMGCRFELTIDGEIASRSYAVNLPVFNNAMEPGYAYKYGLTLQRDTVLFNSVNIIDWNIIDMDGNPLIPEEVN